MIPLRWTAGLVSPVVAALCAVAAGSCAPSDDVALDEHAERSHDVTVPLESVPYVLATTNHEIAWQNLHASVDGSLLRYERLGDAASAAALVDALHLRATFAGSVGDLEAALRFAEESVTLAPKDPASHAVHASALVALHRFEEASRALEVAASHGREVHSALGGIRVARGDYEEELDRRVAVAEEFPSFRNYADLAPAMVAAGRFEEADQALVAALAYYRDVSPFTPAWVQFQRGVIWGEAAGNVERAEQLYRDAIRLVPGYVTASVHLAEIEAERGELDAALARLREVMDVEDPEPATRFAEFLWTTGVAAGSVQAANTEARWEALLDREALAFADHAAEFFLGVGDDAGRALELAELNLENRATDRAFELVIDASIAVGDVVLACEYLAFAGPSRLRVGLVDARDSLDCRDGRRDH